MHGFTYLAPSSRAEVMSLLADHGSNARLLAGGTDLVVGLRTGRIRTRIVIDIKGAPELAPAVDDADGWLSIRATTSLSRLVRDERVRQRFPALAEAAATVGSIQIRNRATLVGNVCNASPAADTMPPLLLYGARVLLTSGAGERRVPLPEFVLGPRETALGAGELVSAIELPTPAVGTVSGFARLTRRRGVDLATISLGCSVDTAGVTRFAFGAVASVPFLVTDRSGLLADSTTSSKEVDRLLVEMSAHTRPISDVRASREYRQAMLLTLSRRLLRSVLERGGSGDGGTGAR